MLEEHGLTLPPETEPLRGLERNAQLGWRRRALAVTEKKAGPAEGAAPAAEADHPGAVAAVGGAGDGAISGVLHRRTIGASLALPRRK